MISLISHVRVPKRSPCGRRSGVLIFWVLEYRIGPRAVGRVLIIISWFIMISLILSVKLRVPNRSPCGRVCFCSLLNLILIVIVMISLIFPVRVPNRSPCGRGCTSFLASPMWSWKWRVMSIAIETAGFSEPPEMLPMAKPPTVMHAP
jgi:hypothetical protein